MIKVSCKDFDVFVTYIDELEKEHTATAFCKSPEAAKELADDVREAIELGYGFAKCRAILEGDTINSWGGKRPGSGRPSVGEELKKPRSIKFSDSEWEEVKKKAEAEGISTSEYIRGLIIINNNEIKRVAKFFVSAKERALKEAEELKERDADCFNNHIKWLEGRASAFESAAEWLEEILK